MAGNEPLMSSESQCHVSCVWYCVLDLGGNISAFTIWDCKLMQSINFREAFRTFDFVCLILLLFRGADPRPHGGVKRLSAHMWVLTVRVEQPLQGSQSVLPWALSSHGVQVLENGGG